MCVINIYHHPPPPPPPILQESPDDVQTLPPEDVVTDPPPPPPPPHDEPPPPPPPFQEPPALQDRLFPGDDDELQTVLQFPKLSHTVRQSLLPPPVSKEEPLLLEHLYVE